MAVIKPIRSESDYEEALARIDEIFDAEPGTADSDEYDVLVDLVELYEQRHHPVGLPSVSAALEFHMDQTGTKPRDLVAFLGSRAKVSEVLAGKRQLTMSMARALNHHLGIPAEVLLQEPGAAFEAPFEDIDPGNFPLRPMANAGWIPDVENLKDNAEELIRGLIERAGGKEVALVPLYRRNDDRRVNAKTDEFALTAWCWQVMATANERPLSKAYMPGTVTPEFMRSVALHSPHEDAPIRVRDYLNHHGIALEFVPHLRRTYLDGAALRLADGRPVIGLTLRYDRIDNFWFCLMHELAHVGLHLDHHCDDGFVDDHTLRGAPGTRAGSKEVEADEWAEEALIPRSVWEDSLVRTRPTAMAVIDMAYELGIHPAIIAGRVRYERGNYRLLSQFVGSNQVRGHFDNEGVHAH